MHGLGLSVALGRSWRTMEVMRVRLRRDRVPIAVIWLLVLVGAFVIGVKTNDPGGAGELGAIVGMALTSLYFFLRRARSIKELPRPGNAPVGSATAAWLRVVAVLLLWVAGSVILIVVRVPDGYAVILAWLLPLAAYLVYRRRRAAGHA